VPPSKLLPPSEELEALKLSFTFDAPQMALSEDGPHEQTNVRVRGELISGEMALRKMVVDQLKPTYFPSLRVPLNLLPPLLSSRHEPDGRMTTTLSVPVHRRVGSALRLTGARLQQLLPAPLSHLVPPALEALLPPSPPSGAATAAPSTAATGASSTAATDAPSAAATEAASVPVPRRPLLKPKKDPAGLTMKFEKTKKFRVGGGRGSKQDVCYPCMKTFIKALDNCQPCVRAL